MTTNNTFTYSNVICVAGKTKGVKGGGNNNLTLAGDEEADNNKNHFCNVFSDHKKDNCGSQSEQWKFLFQCKRN